MGARTVSRTQSNAEREQCMNSPSLEETGKPSHHGQIKSDKARAKKSRAEQNFMVGVNGLERDHAMPARTHSACRLRCKDKMCPDIDSSFEYPPVQPLERSPALAPCPQTVRAANLLFASIALPVKESARDGRIARMKIQSSLAGRCVGLPGGIPVKEGVYLSLSKLVFQEGIHLKLIWRHIATFRFS